VFVSYQRKLSQFLNTQARLAGEPLEEYVQPEGGGFYFALPGVPDERGFLGEGIFA
jgi:deferrochelatase/peroxidase EfeB